MEYFPNLLIFVFVVFCNVIAPADSLNGLPPSLRHSAGIGKVWATLPEDLKLAAPTRVIPRVTNRQFPGQHSIWQLHTPNYGPPQFRIRHGTHRRQDFSKSRKRHVGSTDNLPCPSGCKCQRLKADCNYAQLHEIPRGFPRTIQKLSLIGNKIRHINSSVFSGLDNLKTLVLSNNRLEHIEPDTFKDLVNLRRLRLNLNHIQWISSRSFSGLYNLQRIDLRHNNLTCIQPGTFCGLQKLRHLHLSNNHLAWIAGDAFGDRSSLRTLDLRYNPFTCECPLLPMIENFYKHNGLLLLQRSGGMCYDTRRHIRLRLEQLPHHFSATCTDQNLYRTTPKICRSAGSNSCPTACDCTSSGTVSCEGRGLTFIPGDLPEDMVELNLARNKIESLNESSFANYSNLRKIILDDNRISDIGPRTFSNLKQLSSLYISSNQLTSLKPRLFDGLDNLMILYLHRNRISCLNDESFSGLKSLQILHLSENQIRTISRSSFQGLKNLKYLYLVHNPLLCDCRLAWLPQFLIKKEAGGNQWAKCVEPVYLNGHHIRDLQFNSHDCDVNPVTDFSCVSLSEVCPTRCRCKKLGRDFRFPQDRINRFVSDGVEVDCSNASLAEIPRMLPPNTVTLNLYGNSISSIPANSSLRTLRHLRVLNLDGNGLRKIESNAFIANKQLEELILNNNSLTQVDEKIFAGVAKLEVLILQHNQLKCLKNSSFSNTPNLKVLMLNNNKIRCIEKGIFATVNLESLSLTANPLLCDCHLSWLPDWLRDNAEIVTAGPLPPTCAKPEELTGTPIASLARYHFNCPKAEHACKAIGTQTGLMHEIAGDYACQAACCVEENTIHQSTINSNFTKCPQKCICEADGVYCSDQNLTEIPLIIPADTTKLYLERNQITNLQSGRLAHLSKLHTLVLSYNKIRELPADGFKTLQNLKTLVLSYNHIQCIHPEAFNGLSGLRVLILQGNNISLIPFGAFDKLEKLNNIALGQNPLHCDCNGKWLNSYFRQHFLDNGIALCHSPTNMRHKSIYHSKPGDFVCPWMAQTGRPIGNSFAIRFTPEAGMADALLLDDHVSSARENSWMGNSERGLERSAEEEEALNIASKCQPCLTHPCSNGGSCVPVGQMSYKCDCKSPFHGPQCEQVENACAINPCRNGGVCEIVPYSGAYKCDCPRNFRGPTCAERIDTCDENVCQNGGICERIGLDFRCHCPIEFTGKTCQNAVIPCEHVNPCLNGGDCVRLPGYQYRCDCPSGWFGKDCEVNQDDCIYNRCENGATCVDGINEYICKCRPGYTGMYCERYTWNPQAHITRMERRIGFSQQPQSSTHTRHSPIKTRSLILPRLDLQCTYHLCQNGAACTEGMDGAYNCHCRSGFTGQYCESLHSIGLPSSHSYVTIVPPSRGALVPQGSIEVGIRTKAMEGVIMYYAEMDYSGLEALPKQYLLVYMANGFIRVIFSLNKSQVIYSASDSPINDGAAHSLYIHIHGSKLNFTLDGRVQRQSTQTHDTTNSKHNETLHMALTNPLYFGGVPTDRLDTVARILHANRTMGMAGCILKLRINGRLIDFARLFGAPADKLTQTDRGPESSSPEAKRYGTAIGILPGCQLQSGPTLYNDDDEEKHGSSTEEEEEEANLDENQEPVNISCPSGICQSTGGQCQKIVHRSYIRDPSNGCISTLKLPVATCSGTCHTIAQGGLFKNMRRHQVISNCCQASKVKQRRVWFNCVGGERYERIIKLTRRCSCAQC